MQNLQTQPHQRPQTGQQAARYHTVALIAGTNTIATYQRTGQHYDTGVKLGQQADGAWLYMLDLDSHSHNQDATAALDYLRQHAPARIVERLPIQRSRSERGYHLFFKLPYDLDTGASAKVYMNGVHVGELLGPGAHVAILPTWIAGNLNSTIRLCTADWHALAAAMDIPRTNNAAHSATQRKTRIAEGMALIAGWDRVGDWHEYRDALLDPARNKNASKLHQRLAELRRTPADRSTVYARFVHTLMLSGHALPRVRAADRYRYIAAIAIRTGAAGKESGKGYDIERDTAALIAKIKHGDELESSTPEKPQRWLQPFWCNEAHTGVERPRTANQRPTQARALGRPTGSREQRIKKLYSILAAITPDALGRTLYNVADLAVRLSTRTQPVAVRTVQSYLQQMEERDIISKRDQIDRNGAGYCIIKCHFRGADNSPKPDKNSAKTAQDRGADACTDDRITTHQTRETTIQRIEEEETPKISAPRPVAAAAPARVQVFGVPPKQSPTDEPAPSAPPLGYTLMAHFDSDEFKARLASGISPLDAIRARMAAAPAPADAPAPVPNWTPEPEPEPVAPAPEPELDPALCASYDPTGNCIPEPQPAPAAAPVVAEQYTLTGEMFQITSTGSSDAQRAEDKNSDARSAERQKLINTARRARNKDQYARLLHRVADVTGEDFWQLVEQYTYLGPKRVKQERLALTAKRNITPTA